MKAKVWVFISPVVESYLKNKVFNEEDMKLIYS